MRARFFDGECLERRLVAQAVPVAPPVLTLRTSHFALGS